MTRRSVQLGNNFNHDQTRDFVTTPLKLRKNHFAKEIRIQKQNRVKRNQNLAQFSTNFVFLLNKMAALVKKSFFQNFSPNFYFSQKSFVAQFNTTFFSKKKKKRKMATLLKKSFFKILALIFIFFKNLLWYNLTQTQNNLAQLFFFLKHNGVANFLDIHFSHFVVAEYLTLGLVLPVRVYTTQRTGRRITTERKLLEFEFNRIA